MLTEQQKKVARQLKVERPRCITGTNVIADDEARKRWYQRVTNAMTLHELSTSDAYEFCNIAGVPD